MKANDKTWLCGECGYEDCICKQSQEEKEVQFDSQVCSVCGETVTGKDIIYEQFKHKLEKHGTFGD